MATKKGKIITSVLIGVLILGAIIGLVFGVLKNSGGSVLDVASRDEIRMRVASQYIVPEVECTSGSLLFGKKLSDEQMLSRANDEFIIKYEMLVTRKNDSGANVGYIITATCVDGVAFEPSLYNSPELYKNAVYVLSDKEKQHPIYVDLKSGEDLNVPFIVGLNFLCNGQVFTFSVGINTENDIRIAVNTLLVEIDRFVL